MDAVQKVTGQSETVFVILEMDDVNIPVYIKEIHQGSNYLQQTKYLVDRDTSLVLSN